MPPRDKTAIDELDKQYPLPEFDRLLTAEEIAYKLKIGRTKAYAMMAGNELPIVRIGRCVRVPISGLLKWIEDNTTPSFNSPH